MTFLNEYWLAGVGTPILRQLHYYQTQKKPPQYKLGGLEIRTLISILHAFSNEWLPDIFVRSQPRRSSIRMGHSINVDQCGHSANLACRK